MKKISVILILLFAFLPIPPKGRDGAYNQWSGLIYCRTDVACLHEIAHKLDDEGGWISRTNEFELATQVFLMSEFRRERPSSLAWVMMDSPGLFSYDGMFINHHSEIYANIFEWAEGKEENMPEILRPFYDWERAAELIEKVTR